MFIKSFVPRPVGRGIKDKSNRGKVIDIMFDFSKQQVIEVPKIAEDWAESLAFTNPEIYMLSKTADGFPEEVDLRTKESQLAELSDKDFFAEVAKYKIPKGIDTRRTITAYLVDKEIIQSVEDEEKPKAEPTITEPENFTEEELNALDEDKFWKVAEESGLPKTITKRETATQRLVEG